ncbi:MAG: nucleotide exchange factor GrpE [Flavobacteriaceae bacterium]|jgi:molecular chaperone GrpE|nr:nucleotide exchange factor GrpE [Flavobacteriaceae bacterium]
MSKHDRQHKNDELEELQNQENQQETPEITTEISEEEQLKEQIAQEKDKFIRLFAEFDNYKKRTIKERQDLLKYSNKDILTDLLPVLDDFERAIKELEKNNNNEVLEGLKLIYNKLFNGLKSNGLTLINTQIGDDFNLDFHEAITQIPAPDEALKNKIIDVTQQGYLLHDKVVRYAKVVVGK